MGDHNETSGQQAQCDQPLFSVIVAIILEGDASAGKYSRGILEPEPVLHEILPVLGFIPFVRQS